MQHDRILGIFYIGNFSQTEFPFFGLENHHFQQLARLAPNYGLHVVVFTSEGVDIENHSISGYQLSSLQQWTRTCEPFPNVLYVRGISKESHENEERWQIVEQMETSGIPNINNNAFSFLTGDKLAFHQYLIDSPLRKYLPETQLYSEEALLQALQKFSVVYLKPVDGYESRGLLRMEKMSDVIQLDFSDEEGSLKRMKEPIEKLLPSIHRWTEGKRYILQEGILRNSFENMLTEHRCLLQRVGLEWFLTTHALRRNQETNVPFITAGREQNLLYNPNFPLEEIPNPKLFDQEVQWLSNQLCSLFMKENLQASEFSIDFILGSDQNLHLLECNAKPSGFFLQTGDWQGRMLYISRTLQQARWLMDDTY